MCYSIGMCYKVHAYLLLSHVLPAKLLYRALKKGLIPQLQTFGKTGCNGSYSKQDVFIKNLKQAIQAIEWEMDEFIHSSYLKSHFNRYSIKQTHKEFCRSTRTQIAVVLWLIKWARNDD